MKAAFTAAALIAFALLVAACGGSKTAQQKTTEFANARMYIEYNSSAEDLGFHVEFDGDPWVNATVTGPDGSRLFDLKGEGSLGDQGFTSNFFESAEYGIDKLSRGEFLARFPEGTYTLTGESTEGQPMQTEAEVTHLIPDPPVVTSPADGATVDRDQATISWEPVTDPNGTEVDVYSLQLYPVDPPEGRDPIELNVDFTLEVPPDVTEITVPGAILQAGAEYEFELLVVDARGNQSFRVGTFTTAR